ncbi:Mur ligase family protein [Massilia pseudoviolaceinigra]|uniref:Mur ligase family protein n=1 Tax=Massilia pseudoviolaceinigra TaxID=3057165 RepID=UPI0027965D40|nr:Mur ligase family protein [Massilia sp. CCM 9206]MDQ1920911.1 Mur ligase family protein [Massilia sp. CCM 9206]
MDVLRTRALRGPNRWSRHTAIQANISCTPQEHAVDQMPGFELRLRARFPGIGALRPSGQDAALSLAGVLEAAALALQAQAGCPVSFSRTTEGLTPGIFLTVVEYTEEAVGLLAVKLADALCKAAQADTPFDLADALRRLRELDEKVRMGPGTRAIVHSALARGIPFRRLTEGSKVTLGWGSRQRRLQAHGARMDSTGAIGAAIARDKNLTRKLLDAAGVPVPPGRTVTDADDAWAAALQIGLPVVVKPKGRSQGKGITLKLSSREHVEAAFKVARACGGDVMVERFLAGDNVQLLVIGNKLVAAARRERPQLAGAGLTDATDVTDVTDVTGDVHPELAAQAIEAARTIGLDLCSVDLVCRGVLQPIGEQQGGVIGVNAAPDLRMYLAPSFGHGRPVGEAIVSCLFPDGAHGRIPVVAVTGANGKTTTVRLIAHLLGSAGLRTGMTNTDGMYFEGRRIARSDCSGPRSARKMLLHPQADAAVFEVARGGLLREGLGFDRCQVAVVTNIRSGDHLGLNHIATVEELAAVKRVIVQTVGRDGMAVLNADDPSVAGMAAACHGQVTLFGSGANPLIASHLAQGRRVMHVEDGQLVATDGKERHTVALAAVPVTLGGSIGFQLENVMAAVAAAWGVGIDWDAIRLGLATFVNDPGNTPGRFNVFNYRGATVIADFGHNQDAMRALVQAVETMPARRRSVVISGVPDRREEDLREQTQILGQAFDDVLLYHDPYRSGARAGGDVVKLLRAGLESAARTTHVAEIEGEFLAIDTALGRLREGDLCLILISQVEDALAHLVSRGALAA